MVHDMRNVDRGYKLQCHREGFATVSVFHIHAHEQHMGFFNLHFREPKVFGKAEQTLLEKWARDSKILDIFEGTQQIQQLVVARRLLGLSSAQLK